MANCPHCGAEFLGGRFVEPHAPDCPLSEVASISRFPNSDKAGEFAAAWFAMFGDELPFEREYRFHPARRWRFDFAWPDRRVAVEIDGNAWHVRGGGRHAQDADREKHNEAVLAGWAVFHLSPQQITADWLRKIYDYINAAV